MMKLVTPCESINKREGMCVFVIPGVVKVRNANVRIVDQTTVIEVVTQPFSRGEGRNPPIPRSKFKRRDFVL